MKIQGSYNKDYHMVTRDDLNNPKNADVQARAGEEFRMRVEVAKEKFGNTYDMPHAYWMCDLAPCVGTIQKLNMPLDTCIAVSEFMSLRDEIHRENRHGGGRRMNVRVKIHKKRGGRGRRYSRRYHR